MLTTVFSVAGVLRALHPVVTIENRVGIHHANRRLRTQIAVKGAVAHISVLKGQTLGVIRAKAIQTRQLLNRQQHARTSAVSAHIPARAQVPIVARLRVGCEHAGVVLATRIVGTQIAVIANPAVAFISSPGAATLKTTAQFPAQGRAFGAVLSYRAVVAVITFPATCYPTGIETAHLALAIWQAAQALRTYLSFTTACATTELELTCAQTFVGACVQLQAIPATQAATVIPTLLALTVRLTAHSVNTPFTLFAARSVAPFVLAPARTVLRAQLAVVALPARAAATVFPTLLAVTIGPATHILKITHLPAVAAPAPFLHARRFGAVGIFALAGIVNTVCILVALPALPTTPVITTQFALASRLTQTQAVNTTPVAFLVAFTARTAATVVPTLLPFTVRHTGVDFVRRRPHLFRYNLTVQRGWCVVRQILLDGVAGGTAGCHQQRSHECK